MKRAIILARVSTREQEATGLSLEEIQIPSMREYAQENDFEIVKEFVFQETASQKLRKKFDAMVDFVKEHYDINVIIGFRVDRLTRNYRDAVEMDILRTEYGKELHFVNDKLVLNERSVGRDIQDWDLKVFLAKQHINRCQEDAHNTLQSKLKSGEQYGKAPYGYRNVSKEESARNPELDRVIVETFEAGIVRQVFEEYVSSGKSYLAIAQELNKQYPTLKFTKRKIEMIIKNPYYYGEREFQGILYPHKYPHLIEKDIFKQAKAKREGRCKNNLNSKQSSQNSMYGGLLTCAECGCAFSPSPNRHSKEGVDVESDYYYYCTNSKGKHKKKPKGTNDKDLTEQFADIFKSLQIPDAELEWLTEALRSSHEGKKQFTEEELKKCDSEIKRYQKMIENSYADKCAGSITQEEHDKYHKRWRKEQQEWRDKRETVFKADEEYYITASYLLELASRSYELFMGSEPEQKRQIIELTLQNLRVKDGKLVYDWIKPFDSIFQANDSHTWGELCDDFLNLKISINHNIKQILNLLGNNKLLIIT